MICMLSFVGIATWGYSGNVKEVNCGFEHLKILDFYYLINDCDFSYNSFEFQNKL